MRYAYWFDFEDCGKIDEELTKDDCFDMFSDIAFDDCKPFPTCETCYYLENCDIWNALLSAGYTLQNAFCPEHQDFPWSNRRTNNGKDM